MRLADQLLILSLSRRSMLSGIPGGIPLDIAIAGSVLIDLTLHGLIDTDLNNVVEVDRKHLEDPVLRLGLQTMDSWQRPSPLVDWLDRVYAEVSTLKRMTLDDLCRRDLVDVSSSRLLGVFPIIRYRVVDRDTLLEIRERIRRLVLTDELPLSEDIALVSLTASARLLPLVLSNTEQKEAEERVQLLLRMDFVGRNLVRLIYQRLMQEM